MSEQPNIVFMICHDLGRHLNCYGVETVTSPHLDRLASEGVRFDGAFCVAPQCAPSRAAITTGRYPHANGLMGLSHGNFGWDLHDEEVFLPQRLKEAGYHTVLGSFHHEGRKPVERMGYDEHMKWGGPAPRVADQACDWLRGRSVDEAPFYLNLAFFEPHRRFPDFGHAPDTSRGVSVPPFIVDEHHSREEFAYFQGAIKALDEAVGRIVQAIEDAGLGENTIVVICADHGIPFPRAKCAVYDPGLEAALIMRWPGGGWVAPGTVFDQMIPNVDYLPTLLELIGQPAPEGIHGRSFAPLLRGEGYEPRDAIFAELTYHEYCDPRRVIRTETHKLIVNFSTAPSFMDPSQTWRRKCRPVHPADPVHSYHVPLELYDLSADPHECNNLAYDDSHADLRAALLRRLRAWMQETGDPLLQGVPAGPPWRMAMHAMQTGEAVRVPQDMGH